MAATRTEVLFNNGFCRGWLCRTGAAPKYLVPVMWEPTLCPETANSCSHPHGTTPSPGQGSAASTAFLLAAICPAGQVFVNCSDLHPDPELSRERTCEQQLLNLSMAAHGPCLSGCACPQGYGSTSLQTLSVQ